MSVDKNNKVINNELADMLAALAKANSLIHEVGAAIEESKCNQTASASTTQRLMQLNEELLQMEVEQQAIQKNIQTFDKNDEMLLQMLLHRFNKLGYNLILSRDADNMMLYRFEYGPNRFITLRVEYGQLSLVQICPENPNFLRLKEFLSESQDLNGLLASFGSTIFATN